MRATPEIAMRFPRRLVLGLLAVAVVASTAFAQGYPDKPIRLIVGDAPGGSPDTLGRLLALKLSESIGQPVVVDNKPGAGGQLAAEMAAKAPADGYTLFMNTTTVWAILPNVKKSLPYDASKSFVPISRIASASNVLVVNTSLGASSVADLVRLAKASPGKLNYASAGVASPAQLAGEMRTLRGDDKLTHVPYKGAAPALLDVIAGSAQLIITSPIAAGPHMTSGKVRALATTGRERNPGLPDLPTIAESIPGYEISQSWGIVAPAGTPPSIVRQLHAEIAKAIALADTRERIARTGAVAIGDSPEEFEAFIGAERARLGEVIAKTGIVLAD
jgi:tripartite-type tricarboxylate transporter receptor subunit TctC